MKQLSETLLRYAKQRGASVDNDISRKVYGINKRTPYIDYLLSNGKKGQEGANDTEKKLVTLYQMQPQAFQKIIGEANRRMGLTTVAAVKQAAASEKSTATGSVIEEKCLQLLRDKFPKGIRLASSLDQNRFYNFYVDQYGNELPGDSLFFEQLLKRIGIEKNGRIVARCGKEQTRLLDEICKAVKDTLGSGVSCIFIESLFVRYKEQVESLLQIYQYKELESILKNKLGNDYVIVHQKKLGSAICLTCKTPNPDEDVKNCLREHGTSMTYSELKKSIWYMPFRRIKQALTITPSIICTKDESYMAVELFPVNKEDIGNIRKIIGQMLVESQTGRITDEDCWRMVAKELSYLANDLKAFSLKAFQNALSFFLKDEFEFSTHIISRKN
ncbi:MAG: hypothetical protein IJU37_05345 [Desulfovibrio sp.]|nr:hypothetical protein [Desulfovibrio sp.]